jgi:carbon monoxide dehydrogenase subunit G
MNLQFSGQEHFNAPPHEVFRFLTDIDSLTASIPDLVSSQRVDDRTVDCVVKPGFSFLRGTLKMRIAFVDFEPTSKATMLINAQGIGLTMGAVTKMQLAPTGEGTRLDWQAEVTELKGLVATLSGGLIKAAAEQVIRHGWGQMHKRLGGPKS